MTQKRMAVNVAARLELKSFHLLAVHIIAAFAGVHLQNIEPVGMYTLSYVLSLAYYPITSELLRLGVCVENW